MNFWQQLQPPSAALHFGWLTIYWYGLIVTLAIVAAFLLIRKFYLEYNSSDKQLVDVLFWVIIWGLIGARFFHVFIFQWDYYSWHLDEILQIWQGGIAIQGAIFFGFLVLWFFSIKRQFNLWQWTDMIAPGLVLAQAIGRWGNYFNQELYGLPTNLPWAINISYELRVIGYEGKELFHPVFLYESLLSLILLGILLYWRKKLKVGQLSGVYLIGYGVIRIFTECFKIDHQPEFLGLRLAQYLAMVFIAFGVGLIWWSHKKKQTVL